jgi:predicted nucleotidyltransferase
MASTVQELAKRQLITPPKHVLDGIQYEVLMGSVAYGVSNDTSDMDVYGFSIPPKEMVFPHLAGEIQGFGRQKKKFEQYQQHHVYRQDNKKEYDLSIYSIVKYFQLCMDNNPNMIDSLFVPQRCVLYCSKIGNMVRERRRDFLHKGSWHKFKGYSFSQVNKMKTKNPDGKRKEIVEKYGYDLKFAYHTVRLLNEVEQIMMEHDLDLQRNREQLKAIRRGEWTLDQVEQYFDEKERALEDLYIKSTLPYKPDEKKIKQLLFDCLEEHYGSLQGAVVQDAQVDQLVNEIEEILVRYKNT